MIVKKNKNLIPLVGCFAVAVFALTGCRSGGFNKPNLDALKFWKAPDSVASTKVPPPPARYFDPAPIMEEQVAQAAADETIELNGQRFKQQLNKSLATNSKSISDKVNTNVRSLNEMAPETPINGSLSNAQQDFKAAMKDTASSADQLKQAAAPVKTWNEFELPEDLEKPTLKPRMNQSLAGLNKSIYDANGKLVNSTQDVKNSIMDKLNSTRNSFPIASDQPGVTNQFVTSAKAKATDLTPKNLDFKAPELPKSVPLANTFSAPQIKKPSFMANNTAQATQTKPAANAELKLVQAQVADANRQIEQLKQQIAAALNQPKPMSQAPVAVAAAPTTPPAAAPPVAVDQPAPLRTAQLQTAPVRTAQLQTPRFGSYSGASNPKPENSFVGVSTSNVLRNNQPVPQSAPPVSTAPKAAFPSTPHGNFAPQGNFGSTDAPSNFKPTPTGVTPQPAAPVNFQTANDYPMTLKASTPSSMPPNTGVRKIKAHISQIDIPDSILNGSGSYAPGSVHQVGQ